MPPLAKSLAAFALALCVASLAATGSLADPLFEDDFDDGFAGWSASGDVVREDLHALVEDSVRLQGGGVLARAVPTTGHEDVTIGFFLAARLLEGADACLFEVSTDAGASWTPLLELRDGDDDGVFRWDAVSSPAYDDNPDLQVRFRNAAGSADNCYAEDVSVSGFPPGSASCDTAPPVSPDPEFVADYDPLGGGGATARSELTSSTLLSSVALPGPVDSSAYGLPSAAAPPLHEIEGRIELLGESTSGGFTEQLDQFAYTGTGDDPRKHLPEFAFDFVQTGSHLVPQERGIVLGDHPDWEYVLEPGRVWSELGDGGLSRAALPFALQQKNSNCIHNGLLTFLFDETTISRVAYQITSETCLYFQFDMWGKLEATYTPGPVPEAQTLRESHQRHLRGRIPVAPIDQLAIDHPGALPAEFAHPSEVAPADLTLFGVLVDGVLYTGGCATRSGTHPYCDALRVPSYSLAKTAFASAAALRMERRFPDFLDETIATWVEEAAADPEGDFDDVTIENALDMATGNFRLSGYIDDENSLSTNDFFLPETHAEKVQYAVSRYPREAPPGTEFHYHTTDTYLALAATQRFLREQDGWCADAFDDLIVRDLWQPLGVSPGSMTTRRTYDPVKQPFGGYGLTFVTDDLAKIGTLLGENHGRVNGLQMLAPEQLAASKFADSSDPGLSWSGSGRYNDAFWGSDRSDVAGCDLIVPYLSGYGGITLALLPSGIVYFYVSDGGSFVWDRAFAAAESIRSSCNTDPPAPPTALAAVPSSTGLLLSWAASEAPVGVVRYRVLRDGVEIGSTAGNDWLDPSWTSGTPALYEVESFDSRGVASETRISLSMEAPNVPSIRGVALGLLSMLSILSATAWLPRRAAPNGTDD